MDITPITPKGKLVINRYGNGGFTVNETTYTGSILLLADGILPWQVSDALAITEASLAPVMMQTILPELLIVGAGAQFAVPSAHFKQALRERGIALEMMDTGAACRTYNVLLAEERRIAAALVAV